MYSLKQKSKTEKGKKNTQRTRDLSGKQENKKHLKIGFRADVYFSTVINWTKCGWSQVLGMMFGVSLTQ